MGLSIWQLLLVAVLFMLLFGRGRIPALMSDLAEGIKSFKAGIADTDPEPGDPVAEPERPDTSGRT